MPKPNNNYHKPGDIVYSPGFSVAYTIQSYPLCRLYYDDSPDAKYPLQPHSFEYNPNRKAGDHVSYLATVIGGQIQVYLTDQYLKE